MNDVGEVRELPVGRASGGGVVPRFVRVTNADHRGYVEFQFSIGEPELYLEMTLPPAAFTEFCKRHAVVHLTEEQVRAVEENERKWRYGQDEGG